MVGARGCDDSYAYSVDLVTDSHVSISFPSEFNLSRTNFSASLPSNRCIGGSLASTAFKIARAALAGSPACWPLLEPVGWDQRANRTQQYFAANGSSIAPPSRSRRRLEQVPLS